MTNLNSHKRMQVLHRAMLELHTLDADLVLGMKRNVVRGLANQLLKEAAR
jgi:hypothetical protein